MSWLAISGQTTDPVTGLPVPASTVIVTDTGAYLSTQPTGEPPGGRNTLPGTDPNAPGNADPGLPYGFAAVPSTGTLVA